jgi:phage baseplate assembly protein W
MAIERVSKSFKDISGSFKVNPLTNDLVTITNETAIARSVRNLVSTLRGERFFQNNLGCNISQSLFESISDSTTSIIQSEIETTINNYEPRVSLNSVEVIPDYENNSYDVKISYNIIGIEALPQQLKFALQPIR